MNRDRKLYVAPKTERVHFAFEGVCITASPGVSDDSGVDDQGNPNPDNDPWDGGDWG